MISAHPRENILAQFSLYVHKAGLKLHSFHFQEHWFALVQWLKLLAAASRFQNNQHVDSTLHSCRFAIVWHLCD